MNSSPSETAMDQESKLSERYAASLERWTRARLPAGSSASINVPLAVQQAIAEAVREVDDRDVADGPSFLIRVRQLLQTRIAGARGPRAGHPESSPLGGAEPSPHPLTPKLAADLLARYEASMDRLTTADRHAIIARIELGLSWPDVVELLNTPGTAAARMQVSRALVRLAREMSL